MYDQIKALDALIEAVEEGTAPDELAIAMPDQMTINSVYAAYRGSVDAALAVKEALLPGFAVRIWCIESDDADAHVYSPAVRFPDGSTNRIEAKAEVEGNNPARALLIATLKAYRHELEGKSCITS